MNISYDLKIYNFSMRELNKYNSHIPFMGNRITFEIYEVLESPGE